MSLTLRSPYYVDSRCALLGVRADAISALQQTVGAKTRCDNAQAKVPEADYYVGLEGTQSTAHDVASSTLTAIRTLPTGGVAEVSDVELMAFAWMVVKQRSTGAYAKAQTAHFMVPGMRKG